MSNFSHQGKEKKIYVEKMFNDISKRYDLFNTLSSFGLDRYWRKKLVSVFNLDRTHKFLDVATGTGDVVFSMYEKFKVNSTGVDIAEKMIKIDFNGEIVDFAFSRQEIYPSPGQLPVVKKGTFKVPEVN